jgi:hypothetical protein
MKSCAHSAIKVNLAAQVMSNTLAAAVYTLVAVDKENCTVSLSDTLASQQVGSCLCRLIFFYRILGHEGYFYCSNINCMLHGQQVSINSSFC